MKKTKGLLLITLLLSFILAFFPVWKTLVLTWYRSDDYSHGFFIVPVIIYSLWQKRIVLSELPVQSTIFGLVLYLFSMILYVLAFYAEIKTIVSLTMVFSIIGIVLYFYGQVVYREIFFLLFLLLFMIPVPAQIYSGLTIPLQLFVSQASAWLAMLVGLPVFREGNVIYLPERTLEVVQACSGLRSLMSLLTLSLIIAYFTLRSNWLRMLLLLSGVPVAILVNIARVLAMILAFYYFDFDLTQGTIHTIFGIFIFVFAVVLVFLVKGVLSFWDKSVTEK